MKTRKFDSIPAEMLLAGPEVPLERRFVHMPQVFGHQFRELLALHLAHWIPENLFGGAVDREDLALLVDHDDRVGNRFDDSAITLLALPDGLVHPFQLGDIPRVMNKPDDFAVGCDRGDR